MNCGVFLLLLAIASATPLLKNSEDIRIDDEGTITVSTENGRVLFSQAQDNHMVIVTKIVNQPSRKIEIDNENHVVKNVTHWEDDQKSHQAHTGTINSQLVVLKNIFRQHQGLVDDATFDHVMTEVKHAIERGQVHVAVYNVLKELVAHRLNTSWEKQEFWQKKTFPLVVKDTFSHHPYEHKHYSHYEPENDYTYGNHHPEPHSYPEHYHDFETEINHQYPALKAVFSGYGYFGDSSAQFSEQFPKYLGHQDHQWTADQIHELVSQLRHEEQEAGHFLRRQHHINLQLQYLLALQSSIHYHTMSRGQQQGILQEQKSLVREQDMMVQQHLEHQQQIQRLHNELESQLDYSRHNNVEYSYHK